MSQLSTTFNAAHAAGLEDREAKGFRIAKTRDTDGNQVTAIQGIATGETYASVPRGIPSSGDQKARELLSSVETAYTKGLLEKHQAQTTKKTPKP